MRTENVTFTKDELEAMLVLFDIAVKSAGMAAAQNAVVLAAKIRPALAALAQPVAVLQVAPEPASNGAAAEVQ